MKLYEHCTTAVITHVVTMSGSGKGAALGVGQEEPNYLFTYTKLLPLTHVGKRETTSQAIVHISKFGFSSAIRQCFWAVVLLNPWKQNFRKKGKVVLFTCFLKKHLFLLWCAGVKMPGGEHVGSAESRDGCVCAGGLATPSAYRQLLTWLNDGKE